MLKTACLSTPTSKHVWCWSFHMDKSMLNILHVVLIGIKLSKARQLISLLSEGLANIGVMMHKSVCLATPTSKHVCCWSFHMHKKRFNIFIWFWLVKNWAKLDSWSHYWVKGQETKEIWCIKVSVLPHPPVNTSVVGHFICTRLCWTLYLGF